jgi:hypothetical protein
MKPLRMIRPAWFAAPICIAPCLIAAPACAQTDQTTSLLEALSLLNRNMVVTPGVTPTVTQDGDHFHAHIPLPQLTTPPDAGIEVAASPLSSGVWDITSLAFPSAGTVVRPAAPDASQVSVQYTIGQQNAHARIDPTLAVPSPYALAFSDIALHIDSSGPAVDLTIRQTMLEGTITGEPDRRMTTRTRSSMEGLRLAALAKAALPFTMSVKSIDLRSDVKGLDRARAQQLQQALQVPFPDQKAQTPAPGQQLPMPPGLRDKIHAIVEASAGLMSGAEFEETLHDVDFQAASGARGSISEVKLATAVDSSDDRLAGHYDIGLNGLKLAAAVPDNFANYTPRRFTLRAAFAGIPAEAMRQVLRQATAEGSDLTALREQAIALLNEPGARAGIDALLIEAGPMLVEGSARIRPTANGSVGFDVHLSAHGLDEMLALVQSDPNAQQAMPMLFMAKGMGKPEGDSMVWNIEFADGVVLVNGRAMGGGGPPSGGQRPAGGARPPGVRPPVSR